MSGALFPATNPHSWIFWAVHLHPLTYGVAAVRRALYPGDPGVLHLPGYALSIGLSLGFGFLMYAIACLLVQRKPS
jgi:ABC-type polysaccharide/polyol phosphate export permease